MHPVSSAMLVLILAAASVTPAAAEKDDVTQLRQQVAALRAEIDAIQQSPSSHWLDQARKNEIRTMVENVIADANQRTSFQEAGLAAGHDAKGFFLAGDGFHMGITGHLQFRYVLNSDGGTASPSDDADGFELRRAKIQFAGHLADPKLTYLLRIVSSRNSSNTTLEEAKIAYTFDSGLKLAVGKMKLPFLRQELLSSKKQIAVDRGLGTEFFTLNFAEQIQATLPLGDQFKATLAYSDGGTSESSGALIDTVTYAFTGRLDARFAGDFTDASDLRPRSDEATTLLLGLAVHAEEAELSDAATLAWTADALVKQGPVTALLAYMGARDDDANREVHGLTAEAGYTLTPKWQPFARYDGLWETSQNGDLQAVTVGFNHYLKNHAAKFTVDTIWVFNGEPPNAIPGLNSVPLNSGIGLNSAQGEQTALRAQLQLIF